MRRPASILIITCVALAVALVGFAGAANASATVDLIWIDRTDPTCTNDGRRDCPQLGATISSVAVTDNITLAVILTAGPNGSVGGGVSVNYGDALPSLSVVDFQSLTTPPYLVVHLGSITDQPPYIDNINSGGAPPFGFGIGLPAGQSAYLGTVTFHKDFMSDGTLLEITVGTDGPGGTDDVLDGVGIRITSTTTFNSAYLVTAGIPSGWCSSGGIPAWMEIEINALRAGGKTVVTSPNDTTKVTAKARILKGTALPGTTLDTTLVIETITGGNVVSTASTALNAVTLGVGKGGKGDTLLLVTEECVDGFLTFRARFTGKDEDNDVCTATRDLHKACR